MDQNKNHPDEGTYEYVTKQKVTRAVWFLRASLIGAYLLTGLVFLYLGAFLDLFVAFVCILPVLVFALWFFTWRVTQVEYEFSLFGGEVSVSRILGHRSVRLLCTLPVRNIERVLFCENDDCDRRVEQFNPERTVFAASCEDAPDLFVALARDEDGERIALWFEPTEAFLRAIRRTNPTAVSADCFSHIKTSEKDDRS